MPEAGLIRNSRTTSSPTLRELAAILFRQSRFVVGSFVVVFAATMFYGLLSPRYEAHLKVLLRRGRSDPVASPQPSAMANFNRSEISEEELNSEVELLRDEGLLKQVVEESGLVAGTSSRVKVELAVRRLARTLKVEPLQKSNLIQLRYRTRDPQKAAEVLTVLSQAYMQKHMRLQRPSGEAEFFEQQTSAYERTLRDSEAELVRFGRSRGVAAAALQRDIALQKLGEAEAAYRQLDQERVETEQRITALRAQLKTLPARSVTVKRWADNPQLLEKLKTQLLELQLKRTEMLTRFEPSYRLVKEVDRQIEETRQSIAAEALAPVRDETSDKDPSYEWARLELEKAQVQGESLRARQATASVQVAALRTTAQQMQADSVAQQDLIRTAKAEEDSFLLYRRKREEARIGDALDQRHILNVTVVESPVVPALPARSMLFWFVIGLGAASTVSIAAAFTADYFDPTIRTPSEAQGVLEVPVLAWLPVSGRAPASPAVVEISRPRVVAP